MHTVILINIITILYSLLVLLFPIAIFYFLNEEIRKSAIFYYQTICEFGIVLILWRYCFLNWPSAKNTVLPILLIGFSFFAIAEFTLNTTFFQKPNGIWKYKVFLEIFYPLSFGFIAIALIKHFKIHTEHPLVIIGILSIALVHFSFQYRFIVSQNYTLNTLFLYVQSIIYSIISALIFGIAVTYSLRTMNICEHIFFHLFLALLVCDFSGRYHWFHHRFNQMPISYYFWAFLMGVLFLVFFLSSVHGKLIFSINGNLADWLSIRSTFGLIIFFITVLLTVALFILRFFTVRNAIDVTWLLAIILICWSISNTLAFNVSEKFMKIGFLMGSNKVSEIGIDGSPGIKIEKINQKISFSSEMNFIIDRYNEMADKCNLRGQRLVESIVKKIQFEKDVVRGQIAKQLAHDIESPIGAIRTIIALPHLDTDTARETLWTALTSISAMINRLHFRSSEKLSTELKTYSAAASLEKIFKMKNAEFATSKINLQLKITDSALQSFFSLDLDSFRSILSNLINNSKDEILKKGGFGSILVHLDQKQDFIFIAISDDGTVISDIKLQEMNNGICTSTKHSGKPIGIASAKEKISQFNGSLNFSKMYPIGLKATIKLPAQRTPEWFVTEINLLNAQNLVVFDDDDSVHQTIKIRLLSNPQLAQIQLISCHSEKQLSNFMTLEAAQNSLFLVDYEFRGTSKTGINYIQKFKINRNSILMTSHWDEEKIMQECKLEKFRLLPKALAHNINITTGPKKELDFILVDDHPIVAFAWRSAAQSYHLNYRIFSDPSYFEMHKREFQTKTPLFVDFHLPGQTGFELLESLNGEFPNYYILTGEDAENLPDTPFIDKNRIFFGKTFPIDLLKIMKNKTETSSYS